MVPCVYKRNKSLCSRLICLELFIAIEYKIRRGSSVISRSVFTCVHFRFRIQERDFLLVLLVITLTAHYYLVLVGMSYWFGWKVTVSIKVIPGIHNEVDTYYMWPLL